MKQLRASIKVYQYEATKMDAVQLREWVSEELTYRLIPEIKKHMEIKIMNDLAYDSICYEAALDILDKPSNKVMGYNYFPEIKEGENLELLSTMEENKKLKIKLKSVEENEKRLQGSLKQVKSLQEEFSFLEGEWGWLSPQKTLKLREDIKEIFSFIDDCS